MSVMLRQYLAVLVAGAVAGGLAIVAIAIGGVVRPEQGGSAERDQQRAPVVPAPAMREAIDRRALRAAQATGVAAVLVAVAALLVPWGVGLEATGAGGLGVGAGVVGMVVLAVRMARRAD
jgi:NADH:ubiquinone oxidoreductase subunit 3 (subunit A)